jgi:hypothetical protein
VEKAFWDETKSFLLSKVASAALKRGKTPVNWIFQSPLFSITGCVKRRQNVLPAPFFAYFIPAAFYLLLKVKSELASCLMTKGTFKKSL